MQSYGYEYYPIGFINIAIFVMLITYAIVKHHLMDINIIIRRGLVYSLLAGAITIVYLLAVYISEKAFQSVTGYQSLPLSLTIVFIVALLFQPIKNKIQHMVDKIFFHGTQEMLADENARLREHVERAERLDNMGTLASGLVHEIRNPLAAIKTFTEFLPERYNDKKFREKYFRIVSNEVSRIQNLTQQLLDFSRPNPPQLRSADVHALIDDVLDFLNADLLKKDIRLEKQYTQQAHLVNIDIQKMKQVFLNLFLNAIEAMADPSPHQSTPLPPPNKTPFETTTSHTTQNPEDTNIAAPSESREKVLSIITSIWHNNNLRIDIKDTGKGISPKNLTKLFDPFFTTKDMGNGLGLSVVYSIIEQHGGTIDVGSGINVGTIMRITLPIVN